PSRPFPCRVQPNMRILRCRGWGDRTHMPVGPTLPAVQARRRPVRRSARIRGRSADVAGRSAGTRYRCAQSSENARCDTGRAMTEQEHSESASKRTPVKTIVREVTHPALIPGIGVEDTPRQFRTNWIVLGAAALAVLGVVIWGFASPEGIAAAGSTALAWTTDNFGWLFSLLAIACLVFMVVVGYGRTGGVRLGADDEKPEFSTPAWIAMLFSAGMGIGLLFWGPSEPLVYFADVPYGIDAEAGSRDAMLAALAQSILHWGPFAWAFYALVGGAIAYAAYRRGR